MNMGYEMKFTLILTSQDREDFLLRFFAGIRENSRSYSGPIEIVFVNQGTKSYANYAQNCGSIYVKEIFTPRIGLSQARNIGLSHATGDIVAFPDDDCWYPDNILCELADYFKANQALAGLCVNVFDPHIGKPYGARPRGIVTKITSRNLFALPISVGLFLKLEDLKKVGAFFDETLGAGTKFGSGEETELVYRLQKSGLYIEYNGNFSVYHELPASSDRSPAKAYNYGLGFGFLCRRLISNGNYTIFVYFAYVIFRSLIGMIGYAGNWSRSREYSARLVGAIEGFRYRTP
jgi:glycosyltransferase involved in cell wall biosynthesis